MVLFYYYLPTKKYKTEPITGNRIITANHIILLLIGIDFLKTSTKAHITKIAAIKEIIKSNMTIYFSEKNLTFSL